MIYKCKHFTIQELVPKHIYGARGDKAWELLDKDALKTLDHLRDSFGVMTVNNWHIGGDRNWSGLRTSDSPYYSPTSQHSFGRAFDCLFASRTAEQVRQVILRNRDEFPLLTSMELGTSWLHFDTRNTKRIKTFYP